ncbi:uncharacterized protein LOC128986857 [Macrosteles quadrilineatus]|uniref:uncharacterized protein LOC128986857 n=1 Tax=Macrosteles quadrilineatus TaxID=74068 RepID=UPI0023E17536|nr:uncharacterized protein LOC128986857 [Macrosteles quadrilineatus]
MSLTILQQLKTTFGEIPAIVHQDMKYLAYDKSTEEFWCRLCDKYIHINSPKTLEAHVKSICHRGHRCPPGKVIHSLNLTFPKQIPQIVQNNILVLDVIEEGYECVICKKIIQVKQDPKISMNNFLYHLTSFGHEKKLKCYNEQLDELKCVYGEIPCIVGNNKQYLRLDVSGKRYECTLCNTFLKVNVNNMGKTETEFTEHFQSTHHLWAAKRSKVLSLVPELQFTRIHTYITRNIDYISNNGADLYCSLCFENIKRYPHNPHETETNLKHHVLSSFHMENMYRRQSENNEKLDNLIQVNGLFTDEVLRNLRHIELNDGIFICSVCNEEFNAEFECNEVIFHLETSSHRSNVSEKESRCDDLIDSLNNVLSEMPQSIEENLKHIDFVIGNKFCCTLCEVVVSWVNLESHLDGRRHAEAVEHYDSSSDLLHEHFEYVFGENYEDEMPECVNNNWSLIGYDIDNGTFCCSLCEESIIIDEGTKKEQITWQNLKMHFLSREHSNKLKLKAKRLMETSDKLDLFFIRVPKCILNNAACLSETDNSFFCDKCCVEIQLGCSEETSIKNFMQHLNGFNHKSIIESIEKSIDNAFQYLDEEFGVPESLLIDIDHWDSSQDDADLYCTLCQLDLSVDLDDLKQSRCYLECHVNSDLHKSNMDAL